MAPGFKVLGPGGLEWHLGSRFGALEALNGTRVRGFGARVRGALMYINGLVWPGLAWWGGCPPRPLRTYVRSFLGLTRRERVGGLFIYIYTHTYIYICCNRVAKGCNRVAIGLQ